MTVLDPRIHREIEERMDGIVKLAEQAIKQTGVYGRRCRNGHWSPPEAEICPQCGNRTRSILQRTQLANLQNLANATDSVKALELFVRYQMGRREGEGWRYSKGSGKRFGDVVVDDFRTLGEWAQEIAPSHKRQVHLKLISLYVGFLTRWFVALSGAEEGNESEEG